MSLLVLFLKCQDPGLLIAQVYILIQLRVLTNQQLVSQMTAIVMAVILQHMIFLNRVWDIGPQLSLSLVALKALLSILRVFHPKLPKDARTVLKSQVDVPTTKMDGGEYYHFGLAKGLLSRLKCLTLPTDLHTLKLQFNIDGLPLFRSSKVQFWPILALVNCDYSKSPFIVGLFCGISKPKSVFEYLKGGYNAVSCIQSCLHW